MEPLISIITPCYNQGIYLDEALHSIFQCDDKSLYEIIIVNDGSTEQDTLDILKELETKGYNIIHQTNKGLGAARNAGISAAKGRYILPLDCDNKIRQEFIDIYVEFERDNSPDVVYGDYEIFGQKSEIFRQGELNLQRLFIGNRIDACALFRKTVWEEVGGYDERMPIMGYEDWDFWLRIASVGGKFKYVPKVLFDYRYLNNSMLRSVNAHKYTILTDYMQRKHANLLDKKYLNDFAFNNMSKNKWLALYLFLRVNFPRIHNVLRKLGLVKKQDLI